MEASSPGQRLFMIRLASGDGLRKPESLREFTERVNAITGTDYDHKTVSLLERDLQGWRLKDVLAFAAVDPLKRGERWLAFGNEPAAEPAKERAPRPDPRQKKPVETTSPASAHRKGRKR